MITLLSLLLLAALIVGVIALASFLLAREARWDRDARRPRDAFRGGGFGNGAGAGGFGRGGFGRAGNARAGSDRGGSGSGAANRRGRAA